MRVDVDATGELDAHCGDVGRWELSAGGAWQLVTCCDISSTTVGAGGSGVGVGGSTGFIESRGTVLAGTTGRSPRTCE